MKPQQLSRKSMIHESFSVGHQWENHFLNVWHYHEEIEIIYIVNGEGTLFVGDTIRPFKSGDLICIGSNLPHLWLSGDLYFENKLLFSDSFSIHFHPTCFGDEIFQKPELRVVNRFIEKMQLGIEILQPDRAILGRRMKALFELEREERFLPFMEILFTLSKSKQKSLLRKGSFVESYGGKKNSRLDLIYSYVMQHFKEHISLDKAADLASMTPNSFSRYFRQVTHKTFMQYVLEVRVGFAGRLLLDHPEKSIAEICYECGFNNVSNFNKQFKKINGQTPRQFLKAHDAILEAV